SPLFLSEKVVRRDGDGAKDSVSAAARRQHSIVAAQLPKIVFLIINDCGVENLHRLSNDRVINRVVIYFSPRFRVFDPSHRPNTYENRGFRIRPKLAFGTDGIWRFYLCMGRWDG